MNSGSPLLEADVLPLIQGNGFQCVWDWCHLSVPSTDGFGWGVANWSFLCA